MTGRYRWYRAICIAVVMSLGLAAIVLVDAVRYLHWRMPLFAVSRTTTQTGMTIRHSTGLWYKATRIEDGKSLFVDITPFWDVDGNRCSDSAVDILSLTQTAVFQRHSESVIGYDDGTTGVAIADCVANADEVTVYAVALETRNSSLSFPDSTSPEYIVLKADDEGKLKVRHTDDASQDIGRNFQNNDNLVTLFPQHVRMMWNVMLNNPTSWR
ncbi:hypothetical protein [Bifidobacterium oedipodis]|uniref:Uncharacterized protein n=1 Tax=Bifidobacterium oedipodis TaxID=2675322 RepID=A0A7Y0EMS1_9BIFI|nr:hypothetical protein [Bifidobacterium sp. DSM 109957]NMM93037.1 hypothetical protein [Bifidobacterium sp. DSM 109957]